MTFPVWIVRRYTSRYSLLGAMAEELADAFAARGFRVMDGAPDGSLPGLFLFLNMPPTLDALPLAVRRPGSPIAAVQILVDHPLALDPGIMESTSRLPNFRLALPSIDGLHLLRLRWPTLRHGPMLHGLPRSALCPTDTLQPQAHDAREFDVIVAGSIHTQAEINALRAGLPAQAQGWADEMAALMRAEPLMPFEQAADLVMGCRGVITGNWGTLAGLWCVVTAMHNRARRLDMVRALQGLRTAVVGAEAWREVCTGSLRYLGESDYAGVHAAHRRARVCLAWGPTQFQHTFSERLLHAMAAGCAAVAEDRYLIGRHFAVEGDEQDLEVFDARRPGACRAAVEALLADPERRLRIARQGRRTVEAHHLWEHRVDQLVAIAAEALAPARQSA